MTSLFQRRSKLTSRTSELRDISGLPSSTLFKDGGRLYKLSPSSFARSLKTLNGRAIYSRGGPRVILTILDQAACSLKGVFKSFNTFSGEAEPIAPSVRFLASVVLALYAHVRHAPRGVSSTQMQPLQNRCGGHKHLAQRVSIRI